MNKIKLGLSFDDVLLVPKKGIVSSRKEVSLKTNLTKNIQLNNPIISANMDTATESKMAIVMARHGGIGFIHRFLTIEEQVQEVEKVKRSESIFIESPIRLSKEDNLKKAKEIMDSKNISGIIITDSKNKIQGIITRRDLAYTLDQTKLISEVMTHKKDLVTAPFTVTEDQAKKIMYNNRIEKLPLINEKEEVLGLMTRADIKKREQFPFATKDKKGRLRVGAAVGVKDDFLQRTEALVNIGTDLIVVDVAHGHSNAAISAVKQIKKKFDIDVVAGNVCTASGTRELIKAGADCIKIGVGPGGYCTTRIVTGCGVPQLSAIFNCSKEAKNIPVIADGGIKTSGDIVKALAAGAQTIMIGTLVTGTEESPGVVLFKNGAKYKVGRGMASLGANIKKTKDYENYVAEGVEAMIPYRGSVVELINQLIGGIKSGISYNGAKDILGLQKNAEFIRITNSGMTESKARNNF